MAKKGNKKNERIEKLEKKITSLRSSASNMEKRMVKRRQEIDELYARLDGQNGNIDKLEKKTGCCIFIAVLSILLSVVLFFMLRDATIKIDTLQEKATIQQTTTTQPNTAEEFINAVLPMDPEVYYDKNGNTFYSDPDCKYAINDPVFCYRKGLKGYDSAGRRILIYRLANGGFAYIPSNFSVYLSLKSK